LQELNDKLSIAKKQKFLSLIKDETFWIERTSKGGGIKICNVCGISKITTDEPCELCKLHKDIGGILPDISHLVYATQNLENIKGLGVPFDRFGTVYLLKESPQMNSNWSEDKVLDVQIINPLDEVNTSFRYLGNTAPVAKRDFIIDGNQEDEDKKVKKGDVLSFEIIADGSKGDKRIGILKMDVDYLGLIFAIGLEEDKHSKRKSISRITALSRLMDMFFSGCLNRICNDFFKKLLADSNWRHKNKVDKIFYIIYSGGDDLLIVGPWSEMPYLAKAIHEEFKEFTCNNPDLNISAGIFLCKPKYPISLAGKAAGGELDVSKENGRKRITLFGETVEWRTENNLNFSDLMDFGEFLTKRILDDSPNNKIPRSFVHGLLRKHTQYDT
jgi:CRISPR-associated protein Csm1